MGNLLSARLNNLFPALQTLARLGVSEEDIDDIRTYPEFAEEVAQLVVQRRKRIEAAVGRDEALATQAIGELTDPKLLGWIAKWARLDSAAEAAMRKLLPSELAEIARKHDDWDRVKMAARLLPTSHLKALIADAGISVHRRKDLEGELAAGYY